MGSELNCCQNQSHIKSSRNSFPDHPEINSMYLLKQDKNKDSSIDPNQENSLRDYENGGNQMNSASNLSLLYQRYSYNMVCE
jgi:hypothetical protein